MDVAPATLTRQVRVVRGTDKRDGLRRASEHVAHVVRQLLQRVRGESDLVVHDVVMCRTRRALEATVRLQEEVERVDGGDALVDDSAGLRVPEVVGAGLLDGVEPRVVPLPANNDCERGSVRTAGLIEVREGFDDRGHLFANNSRVLTLCTKSTS